MVPPSSRDRARPPWPRPISGPRPRPRRGRLSVAPPRSGPGPAPRGPAPSPSGPRPSSAPPTPGFRRALGRSPGEPEPLSTSHRGAVGSIPGPGLVQPQLPVGPAQGGVGPRLVPSLTVPPAQGGLVPATGAHAQAHIHHLRGPEARPRAPRAPPAAPAPPPGDPAALEARLRGAERGEGRGALMGVVVPGAKEGLLRGQLCGAGTCGWDPVGVRVLWAAAQKRGLF